MQEPNPSARVVDAVSRIERILEETAIVEGKDWRWTHEEEVALSSFFDAALRAVLATPVDHVAEPAVETLRLAAAMHVATAPLIEAWVNERTELAEDHLLAALEDQQRAARDVLANPRVVERLREAFYEAKGERAARFSAAEELVSSWLAQQPP